ncbi:uncharacterized protein LOC116300833 [Actinia tenebrosa]|uniref:Uncharacterized protein LOC116300833 n=1 Tax=Actinia tenebrosa TaxID=6105 RepID=A0A6P8IG21_ACTTE|nr:uncharacterized protein LOC116300833 [Actinia tenebrosa]
MSIFTSSYTRLSVCLLVILVILYIIHYYSWPSWKYNVLQSKNSAKHVPISPKLRILCFGDSLTAGMKKRGDMDPSHIYPYSNTLKKLFDKHLSRKIRSKLSVRIQTEGVPGERVLGGMKQRLYGLMNGNVTYDWVVILGGTNDLNFFLQQPTKAPNVTAVLEELLELHDLSHTFLARTIAVSIPPRQCERTSKCKSYTDARHYINKELRLYSTSRTGETFYVDIEKEMRTDKPYWSDEVHFNDLGYDRIGSIIFDSLYKNI